MAPSVVEAESSSSAKTRHEKSESRKSTHTEIATKVSNDDSYLATSFRSDLTMMRGLVTCTICDQLLYEPWTLGCGHTYCYRCLCLWFQQYRHKMTCPDCRTVVKLLPAPSFTIKQMIEIFIGRVELLPPDESVEQHRENIRLERTAVEEDRATAAGLFKGCFQASARVRQQWMDEDRVWRCSGCHHEVEDRDDARCSHCNVLFEDADSDDDDDEEGDFDDVDSFDGHQYGVGEYDLEVDMDLYDLDSVDSDRSYDSTEIVGGAPQGPGPLPNVSSDADMSSVTRTFSDTSSDDEDNEENEDIAVFRSSIRRLLGRQLSNSDEPHSHPRSYYDESHITISSDSDTDDESVVSRPRRPIRPVYSSAAESGTATTSPASRRSTTDQRSQTDSESENFIHGYEGGGFSPIEEYSDALTVTSDNSTILAPDPSSPPRRSRDRFSTRDSLMSSPYGYEMDPADDEMDASDDESEVHDRDGDVEMSLSPSTRATGSDSDSSTTDRAPQPSTWRGRFTSVDLGPAVAVRDDADDDDEDSDSESSDESIRPPRRRRRPLVHARTSAPRLDDDDDDDVTLTQLFTRPPYGRRPYPTFDGQRILQWYALMRDPPASPSSSHAHPPRAAIAPSRMMALVPQRIDYRTQRSIRSRNFALTR